MDGGPGCPANGHGAGVNTATYLVDVNLGHQGIHGQRADRHVELGQPRLQLSAAQHACFGFGFKRHPYFHRPSRVECVRAKTFLYRAELSVRRVCIHTDDAGIVLQAHRPQKCPMHGKARTNSCLRLDNMDVRRFRSLRVIT